jgi:hypothetical protein
MKKATRFESTSFHGTTICTTPQKLIDLAEKLNSQYFDQNNGKDKTNFDFEFQTEDGSFFTVYDWKEYRKVGINEYLDFHIGAQNGQISYQAKIELENQL